MSRADCLRLHMRWWNYLWRDSVKAPGGLVGSTRLTMPGWNEDPPTAGVRLWRNSLDEALVLTILADPHSCFESGDESERRRWAREFAQSRGAGLIEVNTGGCDFRIIIKQLKMPAYYYTGMLITRVEGIWLAWTTVARELGTTGVREAVVTATLMSEGKLSLKEYELHWGQDPYDPAYRGVDRSVLRFMSDDESYDQQFPQIGRAHV